MSTEKQITAEFDEGTSWHVARVLAMRISDEAEKIDGAMPEGVVEMRELRSGVREIARLDGLLDQVDHNLPRPSTLRADEWTLLDLARGLQRYVDETRDDAHAVADDEQAAEVVAGAVGSILTALAPEQVPA